MFPYTVPNLVVAWTMLFFFVNDTSSGEVIDVVLFLFFLFMSKRLYGKKAKTISEKSSAIALNLAIFPLLVINIMTFPYFFTEESINEGGMIYILPMIFPLIFFIFII